MRKWICICLSIITIITSCFSVNVYAKEERASLYSENMMNHMQEGEWKYLLTRSNHGYKNMITRIEQNPIGLFLVAWADKLMETGTKPDKKKYEEVLINIFIMMDMDNSEKISGQIKMDNLKSVKDYAVDIADITASLVLKYKSVDHEALGTAIDGIKTLIDNTDQCIDALSDMQTLLYNYEQYVEILDVIYDKADGELKEAAKELKNILKKIIDVKLGTYIEIGDNNFENYSEFIFSDVFLDVLKNIPEYEEDPSFQFAVDTGDKIFSKLDDIKGSWNLGKDIGILIGNITVGAEDLLNRLFEMMALNEIGDILSEDLIDLQTKIMDNLKSDKTDELIMKYVLQSKFLINTHLRGEYIVSQIVEKDAKLLSIFNKNNGKDPEEWYKERANKLIKLNGKYDEILSVAEDVVLEEGNYIYENGEWLSRLEVEEVNGKMNCFLGFWHNYGESSSDEDLFFVYEKGKKEYSVFANRAGTDAQIIIQPKGEKVRVKVAIPEIEYSWDGSGVWVDQEYVKEEKGQVNQTDDKREKELTITNAILAVEQYFKKNYSTKYDFPKSDSEVLFLNEVWTIPVYKAGTKKVVYYVMVADDTFEEVGEASVYPAKNLVDGRMEGKSVAEFSIFDYFDFEVNEKKGTANEKAVNSNAMTPEEMARAIEEHYNTMNNTDDFVVFEDETVETDNGYCFMLRYQGGNEANKLVSGITVDVSTGLARDDYGDSWYLY